jgi:hypothetical protein
MARPSVIADASAFICLGWVDQLQILPAGFCLRLELARRNSSCPQPQPGDVTPPLITLLEPVSAVLLSSLP